MDGVKKSLAVISLGVAVLIFPYDNVLAADAVAKAEDDAATLVYKPPFRGAPRVRIGGGTRGMGDEQATLEVLVPEHTGLTITAQPSLYWFTSGGSAARFEFALIDDEGINPLLEKTLDFAAEQGVQRLSLAEHGITLKPDQEYEWSVALVADPNQRSGDIISGGRIQRVEPSAALKSKLSGANKSQLASIYAEEGIWYDALASISDLIAADPGNASLRAQRAALLDQVGLAAAAEHDRNPKL